MVLVAAQSGYMVVLEDAKEEYVKVGFAKINAKTHNK
jgi:hypothetical protein